MAFSRITRRERTIIKRSMRRFSGLRHQGKTFGLASAAELGAKTSSLHFNAVSQHVFGRCYFAEYRRLLNRYAIKRPMACHRPFYCISVQQPSVFRKIAPPKHMLGNRVEMQTARFCPKLSRRGKAKGFPLMPQSAETPH